MTNQNLPPIARRKSAAGIKCAITRTMHRRGELAPDVMPSKLPENRSPYDEAYVVRKYGSREQWNRVQRQRRADAKALREAPINSPEFHGAVLRHKDCPKDSGGKVRFAHELALARVAPQYEFVAE